MVILEHNVAEKKIHRLAIEVAERNLHAAELYLIGIKENGATIARKLAEPLKNYFHGKISVHEVSVDKKIPEVLDIQPKQNFAEKTVVVIDDVVNSGRVMLYTIVPLLQQKPHRVQTLALLERSYKEFPLKIDYVGLYVSTTPQEQIKVEVNEQGEITAHLV